MPKSSERGAVAVELAILLPVLLLLVLGIAEFGRAFNAQITVTHAAREGVRVMAISEGSEALAAKSAAKNAAASLDPTRMTIDPGTCTPGAQVTMTITYELDTITGIAGPFSLIGKGVMLCGG
ncbi:TadE/TadG family type IV pilus assembly protein [Arthrobacter monumenti]